MYLNVETLVISNYALYYGQNNKNNKVLFNISITHTQIALNLLKLLHSLSGCLIIYDTIITFEIQLILSQVIKEKNYVVKFFLNIIILISISCKGCN